MPPAVVAPPPTLVEPVTEFLHGVQVTDPYRWLEDQNSPRTRAWLEEQTQYTRAYLDAIPGRDRVRRRVEALLAVEVVSEPWKVGDKYFFLKRNAQQEQSAIVMREVNSGDDVILVDPGTWNAGDGAAVSIINISRDGKLLAYGIKQGGSDAQSVGFLDVERRQSLPDTLPVGFGPGLVFSSDGRGFYYSHEILDACRANYRAVYWHQFETGVNEDIEIFVAGEDPRLRVGVSGSPDGQRLVYFVVTSYDPPTWDLSTQDLANGGPIRKLLEEVKSILGLAFAGQTLIALTDWRSPNLRIVSIDPDHPEHANWSDIVPESQHRIKDFAVVGNFVCVSYLENFSNRIDVFDVIGGGHKRIPCPSLGTIRLLNRPVESDTLFYTFSAFDQPPTIFAYHLCSGEQTIWAKTQITFDASSIEVEQVHYKSRDGTDVPMFLVAQTGQRMNGPLPTFITGYGGFGASITPQFNAYSTFLIEHGFLVAIPSVRGGGELGEEWHKAGKRHNRQKAVDDFIAATEWLLASGYAAPGRIAAGGGSNGGLLVGATTTQRPDLFRAVLCLGPLLDMVRYHLFDFAKAWVDEYGTPEMQDDFCHLWGYSPYHRVAEGVSYPSVLLVSGDADTRCNPMHARKMTARLQAATRSGLPILLNYDPVWGHVPMQRLTRRIDALTDRLAFICCELAVNV